MKALPIRVRLTAWYFLMFASAGLLLGLTSWWMLRHTLNATIGQDLQERVDDIQIQLSRVGPQINPDDEQRLFRAIYQERDDGKWLQIIDQDGRILFRSARMTSLQPGFNLPARVPAKGILTDVQLDTHAVRFFCAEVNANGQTFRVDTGISMAKPHALLHRFGLSLLLLTPLLVILSVAGGHVMSRKALAPVGLIAREARLITDRNLKNRLPVPAGNDELSHLSITLNHMLARIDSGFRSVREFTANASHELRTPLARLRAEVEIALLRPRNSVDYRLALERVHEDALDMSNLVENLLTLARAEAGSDSIQLSVVDVESLFEESVQEWRPVADRLGLQLSVQVAQPQTSSAPLRVLGDRLSLLRLLRIWLDNAFKFTPAGGRVMLGATVTAGDVLIAVEDTGIGIDPEHHSHIFERFYRVPTGSGYPVTGAGLGLSLAAWIAEQHQGRIMLESAPGRGTRIYIRLRVVSEGEAVAQPGPTLLQSQPAPTSGS